RLFRAFARKPKYDFSPEALAIVSEDAASIDTQARRDPVNCALFTATVVTAREPVKTLRVMAETGLLAKMAPVFASLGGRIEYGLYRRYTLDEQVFQAIGVLRGIHRGDLRGDHPIASQILDAAKDPAPYFIAVLMHETRASLNKPTSQAVEKLVRRVSRRLGLSDEDADDVAWAVAHYEDMGRRAERRSLSDARTIVDFASQVETRARLDLVLVLCVCRLRVVGDISWDRFYRRQLALLYRGACAWLTDGARGVDDWLAARADAARALIAKERTSRPQKERAQLEAILTDDIARTLSAEQLTQFLSLATSIGATPAAVALSPAQEEGFFDIMVYAEDRPGLLADLAGATATAGVDVRTVTVLTTPEGRALDIFTVRSAAPDGRLEVDAMSALHAGMLKAARGRGGEAPFLRRRVGDRRTLFAVEPIVRIDLEASDDFTVVEAEGRDRPGLLYKLAAALADVGVAIDRAYIATYGERAVDSFYIQDAPGYKIVNKRRLQSIERRLLNVLSEDE
ncbi:MAG: hypothetical protein AAGJ87_13080, partial [Pseudomonadota bacterium]